MVAGGVFAFWGGGGGGRGKSLRRPLPVLTWRYVVSFPLLQGSLAHLDTKNPVMYLDFPQGRYKLFGELVRC